MACVLVTQAAAWVARQSCAAQMTDAATPPQVPLSQKQTRHLYCVGEAVQAGSAWHVAAILRGCVTGPDQL
jgi:hypothetical protein